MRVFFHIQTFLEVDRFIDKIVSIVVSNLSALSVEILLRNDRLRYIQNSHSLVKKYVLKHAWYFSIIYFSKVRY